jgi:peptidyl-prolyl cis-trans isomerase D
MLRGIRKASGNWLGKLVMGLVVGVLVISFAVWGIGDIFRGFGRSTVAKVGGTEIGFDHFRQIYTERVQQLGTRAGRPITAEQARALGLDRQILAQIISETALDERARQLGLGIADAEVARQIHEIPAFHGPGGRFDARTFEQRIRSAGYTEGRFVAEQRRFMVRNQLTQSVSAVPTTPKTMMDAVNQFQNERRAIEYVTLDRAHAGEIKEPTQEEIASFFEGRKTFFRAPEYRKIVVLPLTNAEVAKWMQVSDEDAKKAYDERKSRYITAGRRHLQQIIFPTPEEAKAAKDRIDTGVSFETIATERGLSEKDIDLGLVAKSTALAPAVAEAAFAAAEGAVAGPAQSRVGSALVRVLKIEPDQVRPFEEVSSEIKQDLARERTRAEINQKHDKLEDERAGGQTLTEAAQKVGMNATTIEAVDRNGLDPSGARVFGLPPEADVLSTTFATEVGVEIDPVRVADGGYVWVEVAGVTPGRERKLDEVRDEVIERWRDDQVAERLRAKADELIAKLKSGTPLADVAVAENLTVEAAADLQRGRPDLKVPAPTIEAAFRTPKGAVGAASGQNLAERVVFRVTEVTVPPLTVESPDSKRLEDAVRTAISGDLLAQYSAQVERDLGTTINADALRRISGGEAN